MADEKISAMTSATFVDNSDVLPIVQGGANFKATKELILTAHAGEPLTLKGSASHYVVMVSDALDALCQVGDGNVQILAPAVLVQGGPFGQGSLAIGTGGDVTLTIPDGQIMLFTDQGGNNFINIDSTAGTVNIAPNNGFDGNIGNISGTSWSGGAPAHLSDCVNRLAVALAGLLGTTIP